MPVMCPMDGCKAKKGLCIHDKMMIAGGVLFMVFAVAHWGLNLI